MKKLLLSFCLMLAMAYFGYTQGVQLALTDSNGLIQPNSHLSKNGLPTDLEIVKHLNVVNTNTTGNALDVLVKKTYIYKVPGAGCDFCWAACYSEEVFVSPESLPILPGDTNKYFSSHYRPLGNKGMSTVRWTFFEERNPLDSVCVNIDYSAFPAGMDDNQLSLVSFSAYPNPADQSATFSYELSDDLKSASAILVVRNVLGSALYQGVLQNNSGKIIVNTANLCNGVYFYSLNVNGKSVITKKLIVKH